jgi:hypothetical protein
MRKVGYQYLKSNTIDEMFDYKYSDQSIGSLMYPLSFLEECLNTKSNSWASKAFEHLKLLLIRCKNDLTLVDKNIAVIFYDGYLNARIFIFDLNSEKENLLAALNFLDDQLKESFESWNNKFLFTKTVFLETRGDWKVDNSESFIDSI